MKTTKKPVSGAKNVFPQVQTNDDADRELLNYQQARMMRAAMLFNQPPSATARVWA
jgi:hypothetical protein